MTQSISELRAAGVEALRRGEAERALELFERVIAAGGEDAELCLALSRARALRGDHEGKALAIDRALQLQPNSISALVAKGDYLAESGNARAGAGFYAAALRHMPEFSRLGDVQQQELLRAKAANEKHARDFEDHVRTFLGDEGVLGEGAPPRFARAVDILVGKRRPYMQTPRFFYFPELPQVQFYPRTAFDWIEGVEAAFPSIRAELDVAIGNAPFEPYLKGGAGRPQRDQGRLAGSADWGAYFLIKDGAKTGNGLACPRTMAALANVPMPHIPRRTPHALFSKLAAGAHIPPHTGMLNVRLICHLALIVPPNCAFRVGNELRAWEEGKVWAFDDTIEHEARNGSDQDRYVLIFDVWRPELSAEERAAVAALCAAVDAYGGPRQSWDA